MKSGRLIFSSLIGLATSHAVAEPITCDALFKAAPIEDFLRFQSPFFSSEIRNVAAKWHLLLELRKKLPVGLYDVEIDGTPSTFSVYFDKFVPLLQLRLASRHLTTTENSPLTRSTWPGAEGSRSGVGVKFQFLDGQKLVITNQIISGSENSYDGLSRTVTRVEFDLTPDTIASFEVTETVTNTSVFRKRDQTFTIQQTVKVIAKR